MISSLTPNWHVFALDYRGHGKSGRVPGKYKARDHFPDLKAFIFENFSEPVVLLGHSMGAGMSVAFAEEHPDKLRGLILGDASLDQDHHIEQMTTRVMQRFYSMIYKQAGRPLEELAPSFEKRGTSVQSAEDLSQLDPGVLEHHAEGRLVEYFEGVYNVNLDKITCPILMIQGNPERGGILSDREVKQALTFPHVSHVLIEHAGHSLGFGKGELTPFIDAVTKFLEKLK